MLLKKVDSQTLSAVKEIREDLHMHPETGFQERRTSALVAARLREVGVDEVRTGVAETGVIGILRGTGAGRTVALRADMDALPIQEESGMPYASSVPGVMHACGHDGHTAILLGAAEALAGTREHLRGTVKFIFQPAEEGLGGGLRMAQAGCLEDPKVDAAFALHGMNGMGTGRILLTPTPTIAASMFEIKVEGKGGHGAMPTPASIPS